MIPPSPVYDDAAAWAEHSYDSALTPEQERELAHHVWRIHWALGDGDSPQDVE